MELREYLILVPKWWLLIICCILGGGVACLVSFRMTLTYESSTLILIGGGVDADLRRPSPNKFWNCSRDGLGLGSLLVGEAAVVGTPSGNGKHAVPTHEQKQ